MERSRGGRPGQEQEAQGLTRVGEMVVKDSRAERQMGRRGEEMEMEGEGEARRRPSWAGWVSARLTKALARLSGDS